MTYALQQYYDWNGVLKEMTRRLNLPKTISESIAMKYLNGDNPEPILTEENKHTWSFADVTVWNVSRIIEHDYKDNKETLYTE